MSLNRLKYLKQILFLGHGGSGAYPDRRTIRTLRLGLVAVALATVGVTVGTWQFSTSRPPTPPFSPKQIASPYPAPKTEIRGFQFSHTEEGQPVFGISADAFRIQHQKVGFFRFGLLREAVLVNARIELHVARAMPGPNFQDKTATAPDVAGRYRVTRPLNLNAMATMATGRISGFRAAPVTFIFLGETGAALSRIDGRQALARFKDGNLLIDGKVSIAAGNRRLKAEQIVLQPESGTIQVPGAYVLESENGRVTGQRLITDLELNVPT
jgi:hypothetical protein